MTAAVIVGVAIVLSAGVARVPGKRGDPDGALWRLHAIGSAYLDFAREESGWFVTAFALPEQHTYAAPDGAADEAGTPLGQLRAVLDELVEAGVLSPQRRDGIEYPIWSAVHGLGVLAGQRPLRDITAGTRRHLEDLTLTLIGESLT